MKKYRVPVTFQNKGYVDIKAESLDQLMFLLDKGKILDNLIPKETKFIEGSCVANKKLTLLLNKDKDGGLSACTIVRWFIAKESLEGEPFMLIEKKLPYLLYFAQAMHLALVEAPLFYNPITVLDDDIIVEYMPKLTKDDWPENLDILESVLYVLEVIHEEFGQYEPRILKNKVINSSPYARTEAGLMIQERMMLEYFRSNYSHLM